MVFVVVVVCCWFVDKKTSGLRENVLRLCQKILFGVLAQYEVTVEWKGCVVKAKLRMWYSERQ